MPKLEIIDQITIKYNKLPQNIPNDPTIDQRAINIPISSIAKPSKIYPNWDFRLEKMPSGNPGHSYIHSNTSFLANLCRFRRVKD
jgi:hypothetical protein